MIDIHNLSFTYPDGTPALSDLSFSVPDGEAVALVGANGAGKSTLLLHLNGILMPPEGCVGIGGTPLTKKTLAEIRRSVGMVFQDTDDQLFMPTVFEDVCFGPLNAGLPPEEVQRRGAEALEQVGLLHLKERLPSRLSAGEKRGAAIAGVLAMSPAVLVMDEPSSNLDPRARRRLIELLRSFGHTRMIATHDLELAVEVCDRTLLLDGGKLIADGPTTELLNDEKLMLAHGLERPHILRHRHPH